MRVRSDKQLRNGGWLHRLDNTLFRPVTPLRRKHKPQSHPVDVEARALESRAGCDLSDLASQLGVTVISLERLWTGWDGMAWTFPMRDGRYRIIGIRRRFRNGKKLTMEGSHNGLFIPDDVLATRDRLLICEGPTDCAALLDLGYDSIGRPSCSGGMEFIKQLLRRRRRDVVIVADNDKPKRRLDGTTWRPGLDGARSLRDAITPLCRSVLIIKPPRHKDIRQWVNSGVTRDVVDYLIRNVS